MKTFIRSAMFLVGTIGASYYIGKVKGREAELQDRIAKKENDVVKMEELQAARKVLIGIVISNSKDLGKADQDKIDDYARTIFQYAPKAAMNQFLLGALLTQAVKMDGVDVATINMLVNLENAFKQSKA